MSEFSATQRAASFTQGPVIDACICGAAAKPAVFCKKSGFEITRCDVCGVGRTQVEDFNPDDFYTEAYFTGQVDGAYLDYEGSSETIRSEARDQVDFLRKLTPGGKLLEIGCAYGFFLQEAKVHFDVYGIEVAASGVDFCHRNGLPNVQRGVVTREFLAQHGPFDAIVMLDVIEHIDDVQETIKLLSEYMSPNATFLITTGDWDSVTAKFTGEKWRLLTPPLHLWFFTPRSLSKMFERLGFAQIHLSHPWKLVPIELIISQGLSMMGIKRKFPLPKSIKTAGFYANMFDAMRIVFRKKG